MHFRYVGSYEQHECKVELRDVRADDAGTWTCEVEKYDGRSGRGYGEKGRRDITVEVQRKITKGKFFYYEAP